MELGKQGQARKPSKRKPNRKGNRTISWPPREQRGVFWDKRDSRVPLWANKHPQEESSSPRILLLPTFQILGGHLPIEGPARVRARGPIGKRGKGSYGAPSCWEATAGASKTHLRERWISSSMGQSPSGSPRRTPIAEKTPVSESGRARGRSGGSQELPITGSSSRRRTSNPEQSFNCFLSSKPPSQNVEPSKTPTNPLQPKIQPKKYGLAQMKFDLA